MKRTVSQQSDVNGDCSAGFTSRNEKSEPSIECDVSKGVTRESELADSHCRANAHRVKIAGHNRLVKVNHLTRRQVAATVNTAGIPRPAPLSGTQ
ncbi:hypothetical protein RR46_13109 [Papilio xuthus]|uniref:Uncharacterized protein n=1 Tax=Papilio xuthus TaxID=66420 RepID=A0A194PMI1_PAPXU|nr:hypothetical protein RR46_13109 [Papilio xuthus]